MLIFSSFIAVWGSQGKALCEFCLDFSSDAQNLNQVHCNMHTVNSNRLADTRQGEIFFLFSPANLKTLQDAKVIATSIAVLKCF